jgi:hypothetical protein
MPATKPPSESSAVEATKRALEARLSGEQCELLRRIRNIRTKIGPITKDVGTMLRELDEAGVTDAA